MNVEQGLGLQQLLGLTQLLDRHLKCFSLITFSESKREKTNKQDGSLFS